LQNSLDKLSFSKVVSARTQVVQGTMYHLTIEVQEGGNPRLYDAKVWVKPWENFKKLEEFKPAVTPSTFTSADLGTRTGTWAVHIFACVQVVIFSGPNDLTFCFSFQMKQCTHAAHVNSDLQSLASWLQICVCWKQNCVYTSILSELSVAPSLELSLMSDELFHLRRLLSMILTTK
jgi:hypothetical protein